METFTRTKNTSFKVLTLLFLSVLFLSMNQGYAQNMRTARYMQKKQAVAEDKWHAALLNSDSAKKAGVPLTNLKVVNFAVENLGRQVGNGECWTLAREALLTAAAEAPRGYVFGRLLAKNDAWLPGDIIQFDSCHFEESYPGGWSSFDLGWPNHTAIIHSVAGSQTLLLHQNFGNDRRVQTLPLNFAYMVSGNYRVYRPIPASDKNPNDDREPALAPAFRQQADTFGAQRPGTFGSKAPGTFEQRPGTFAADSQHADVSMPYRQYGKELDEILSRLEALHAKNIPVSSYLDRVEAIYQQLRAGGGKHREISRSIQNLKREIKNLEKNRNK